MKKRIISLTMLIVSFLLGISVFLIYLPINDGGYFSLFVMCFQLIIIFVYHWGIKSNKLFYAFSGLLFLSNAVNCVITDIWTQNKIEEIQHITPKQGADLLGLTMASAAFAIVRVCVTVVTVVIFIECVTAVCVRIYKRRKKVKTDI